MRPYIFPSVNPNWASWPLFLKHSKVLLVSLFLFRDKWRMYLVIVTLIIIIVEMVADRHYKLLWTFLCDCGCALAASVHPSFVYHNSVEMRRICGVKLHELASLTILGLVFFSTVIYSCWLVIWIKVTMLDSIMSMDLFDDVRRMNKRQLYYQILNFGMIVSSALMIWKVCSS